MITDPDVPQSTCEIGTAGWVDYIHACFAAQGRRDRAKGIVHANRVSTPNTDTTADYQTQREGDWTR